MKLSVYVLIAVFLGLTDTSVPDNLPCLQPEEKKLYDIIMAYRKEKKLPGIPLSAKLTKVAQIHAKDLAENHTPFDPNCNMHSWSDKGNWTACCYTNDHKDPGCMWNKPKEITGYESNGFEISFYSGAGVTAEQALESWKTSNGHNQVIINESIWKNISWKAIGVGIYEDYGVVWLGQLADTSEISDCK
jgi:hypothetical protein